MRLSTFALLAAGMFLVAGTSDLRAQDADTEAEVETPTDVQVVEATIFSPGSAEPTVLNAEFSGAGESMTAALTVPEMEGFRMEMDNLQINENAFTFSFLEPGGTSIDCDLMRLEDDSFRGECGTGGGPPVEMTIGAFEE